jgi:tetratricopeptide (TPR) repeat protein
MSDQGMPPEEHRHAIARAQALMDIDRWDEALLILLPVATAAPDSSHVLCRLAQCYCSLGDLPTALYYADMAIAADPENELGYRLQSVILKLQGENKPALLAAREAVRLVPTDPSALYTLCSAEIGSKRYTDALQTVEQLRRVAPACVRTHEMLALIAMGQKRWQAAESHLHNALKIDPNSYWAHNNMGVVLLQRKMKLEAIEYFHQAARINPSADTARSNLKQTVNKYLGASTAVGAWLVFLVVRESPSPWLSLLIVVAAAAIVIGVRRSLASELHPEVRAYMGIKEPEDREPKDRPSWTSRLDERKEW